MFTLLQTNSLNSFPMVWIYSLHAPRIPWISSHGISDLETQFSCPEQADFHTVQGPSANKWGTLSSVWSSMLPWFMHFFCTAKCSSFLTLAYIMHLDGDSFKYPGYFQNFCISHLPTTLEVGSSIWLLFSSLISLLPLLSVSFYKCGLS